MPELKPPLYADRLRLENSAPERSAGEYILYWMCAQRRPARNFALDYAVKLGAEHGVPVLVFEALRIGYEWASDRHHQFILDGMQANAAAFSQGPLRYVSFVEREENGGKGLLMALASRAIHVVTDAYPCFFLPKMIASAGRQLDVTLTAVDGCGLLPLSQSDRVFTTAASFRRHLQKTLPSHLHVQPSAEAPNEREVASGATLDFDAIKNKWPAFDAPLDAISVETLPIDHSVPVVQGERGGRDNGLDALSAFMNHGFERYADERNHPDAPAQSNLSAYLHYGHVGAHDVFATVADHEGWTFSDAAEKATGKRTGWWGMSEPAEAFVDEFVTWRELGHVFCAREPRYTSLAALPNWAQETISIHGADPREYVYTDAELDAAQTHDPVWNAAQRQLVAEGRIHNYLRMLWGKKIYEWSRTAEQARVRLIHLNNRYSLDGRDPNSYSGIFWIFGRFDRAWGPEREVYGKLRYMTSDSARRKLKMTNYLERYSS